MVIVILAHNIGYWPLLSHNIDGHNTGWLILAYIRHIGIIISYRLAVGHGPLCTIVSIINIVNTAIGIGIDMVIKVDTEGHITITHWLAAIGHAITNIGWHITHYVILAGHILPLKAAITY